MLNNSRERFTGHPHFEKQFSATKYLYHHLPLAELFVN
jgi:hypothetical protein